MKAKFLKPLLEKKLGFNLHLIEDIQKWFADPSRYPDSYRDVMTIEEEMVGSMYGHHIFSDAKGDLVGLNFHGAQIEDYHLSFFSDDSLKSAFKKLKSLNLSQTNIKQFSLSEYFSEIVFVCMKDMKNLERLVCKKNLSKLARLELSNTRLRQLKIPEGYQNLYYLIISNNRELSTFEFGSPCQNLQILFIRGTSIKELQFPKGFDNLVYLYLNDNNIESISLNGYLPHLSLLSLKNNNLKSIPDNILQLAPNLSSLYLGNNPKPDELSTLLEDIPNQNQLQH